MGKKRVLFIGIGFYDYENSIIDQFIKLGYEVDYFSEVPVDSWSYRFYSRFNIYRKLLFKREQVSNEIARNCDSNYDIVFIIKCEFLTDKAIATIKLKNPHAKYILYLWDSINRIKNIESKFHYFDKVFSFDRLDCLSNKTLNFNPLFFRNEYSKQSNNKDDSIYDLYHLGWYHSDRLRFIKKLEKHLINNKFRYKIMLFSGYYTYLMHQIFGGELRSNRKYLIFKTLSAKRNLEYLLKSKAALDIAHPLQSGLTMRTIELLGIQRKIITTNSDIVNYDFYHPNNVLVIDRENPILCKEFFELVYIPVSEDIIMQYSLERWLTKMLD